MKILRHVLAVSVAAFVMAVSVAHALQQGDAPSAPESSLPLLANVQSRGVDFTVPEEGLNCSVTAHYVQSGGKAVLFPSYLVRSAMYRSSDDKWVPLLSSDAKSFAVTPPGETETLKIAFDLVECAQGPESFSSKLMQKLSDKNLATGWAYPELTGEDSTVSLFALDKKLATASFRRTNTQPRVQFELTRDKVVALLAATVRGASLEIPVTYAAKFAESDLEASLTTVEQACAAAEQMFKVTPCEGVAPTALIVGGDATNVLDFKSAVTKSVQLDVFTRRGVPRDVAEDLLWKLFAAYATELSKAATANDLAVRLIEKDLLHVTGLLSRINSVGKRLVENKDDYLETFMRDFKEKKRHLEGEKEQSVLFEGISARNRDAFKYDDQEKALREELKKLSTKYFRDDSLNVKGDLVVMPIGMRSRTDSRARFRNVTEGVIRTGTFWVGEGTYSQSVHLNGATKAFTRTGEVHVPDSTMVSAGETAARLEVDNMRPGGRVRVKIFGKMQVQDGKNWWIKTNVLQGGVEVFTFSQQNQGQGYYYEDWSNVPREFVVTVPDDGRLVLDYKIAHSQTDRLIPAKVFFEKDFRLVASAE